MLRPKVLIISNIFNQSMIQELLTENYCPSYMRETSFEIALPNSLLKIKYINYIVMEESKTSLGST